MPQPPKLIGAVERALDILNLFDARAPELGTTEIAEVTGLHKSTAAGLIHTLAVKGYLAQNPITRKYRLGIKLVERAAIVLGSLDLRQAAAPVLQQLRDTFDEAVNLAIFDDGQIVYVECLLGTKGLGMHSKIGQRGLIHSTALGKAIFSCLPLAQVRAHIERGLPQMTVHTITDPNLFQHALEDVRRQGYALDDEENEEGGRCVAAPIFDHTGTPIAAVSVSMPMTRLPLAEVPRIGARVREAALAISASLGYSPEGVTDRGVCHSERVNP